MDKSWKYWLVKAYDILFNNYFHWEIIERNIVFHFHLLVVGDKNVFEKVKKTDTSSNCWQLELRKTYLLAGFTYSSRIPHEAMPESSVHLNEPSSCLSYGQQTSRSTSPSNLVVVNFSCIERFGSCIIPEFNFPWK